MYTSDRRLYLTLDGDVVEEGNPKANTLLVAEGGELPEEDAAKYGLTGKGRGPEVRTQAVEPPDKRKSPKPLGAADSPGHPQTENPQTETSGAKGSGGGGAHNQAAGVASGKGQNQDGGEGKKDS